MKPVLHSDVTLPHPPNLALPNLVHRFVTLNRPPRTTELPEMPLGTDPLLDGAVILFQNVVQILNRPVTASTKNMTIAPVILEQYPDLNEAQRGIVAHIDGPLLVIAGPGSGNVPSGAVMRACTPTTIRLSRWVMV
jgi:hypothetical protein